MAEIDILSHDKHLTYTRNRTKKYMTGIISAQLSILAFIILALGIASLIFSSFDINHETNSGFPGNIDPNTWLLVYSVVNIVVGSIIIIFNCIACCYNYIIVFPMFIMFSYTLFWTYWGFVGTWLYFQELLPHAGQKAVVMIAIDVGAYIIYLPCFLIYMFALGGIGTYLTELKKYIK